MTAAATTGGADIHCLFVTADRLADLKAFAAKHGKFGYCSCMRWRLSSSEFQRSHKAARAGILTAKVIIDVPVGVLAYRDGEPIAWCSIAPRNEYQALLRYKAIPKAEAEGVWSVVCFYLAPKARRQGLTLRLLQAAVSYAIEQGAKTIEGYPVEPGAKLYTYMGSVRTFQQAGFADATPVGSARRVMRLEVGGSGQARHTP